MHIMADDDMIEDTNQPEHSHDCPEDEYDDENETDEDFESLNMQLDQLNSALDELEQKNDDIHAQLILLLQSNKEARQQIQDTLMKGKKKQKS